MSTKRLVSESGKGCGRMVNGSILSNFKHLELSTADNKHFTLEVTPFNRLALSIFGIPHLGFRMRARIILSEARKTIKLSHNSDFAILDAGCGYGLYSMSLAECGHKIDSIDLDPKRTSELSRMAQEYPILAEHMNVHTGSLTSLPFANASYDLCICSEVIEHIPDDTSAVKELSRILKPGGTLILSVPHPSPFNQKFYRRFEHERPGYTHENLETLFKPHGVHIEKTFYYEFTFGTKLFNIFNSISWKPLMGLLFYLFYILYLIDYICKIGPANQIVIVARKQ